MFETVFPMPKTLNLPLLAIIVGTPGTFAILRSKSLSLVATM